ncbi:MAG: LysM peptidoglycan-binding domain-containing protein [Leptospiraceae bacterium]|nr:LysM peptidoglycan-binding domain-containing protein [Leptospiraceae bacterium]MDW7976922.1 LysM peptidoglycan-binding domain-containing protein [Leptospiraceae bacterium]
MKSINYSISNVIYFSLVLFSVFYCSKPVPVEDVVIAREAIDEISQYNVSGKSQEYYNKAVEELKLSHSFLPQEKYEDAKEKAQSSFLFSRLSLYEWYPKLFDQYEKQIQEKQQRADELNAEIHAKGDFETSKSFLQEAKELRNKLAEFSLKQEEINAIEKSDYKDAKQKEDIQKKLNSHILLNKEIEEKYEKSLRSANVAVETSLVQKGEYINRLNSLERKWKTAKEYQVEKYEPEISAVIEGRISETREQIQNEKLKVAYQNLLILEEDIGQVYQTSLERYSGEILKIAQKSLDNTEKNVKASSGALKRFQKEQNINEILLAARESKQNAEKEYENKQFETSIHYSKETIDLTKIINEMLKDVNVSYQRALAEEERRKKEELAAKEKEIHERQTIQETVSQTKSELIDENIKLIYTVRKTKPAESLWRIAGKKEIYNNPRKWPKIYDANKDQIKDPDLIYPGQKLKIPKE